MRNGVVVEAEWVCGLCACWDFRTIFWIQWNKGGADWNIVIYPVASMVVYKLCGCMFSRKSEPSADMS